MEQLLKEIGFSEKQAKVYLACLVLGKDTVFNIAKKAELKRPTVYLILEDLVEKGLIGIEKTPRVTFYTASNPKKLLTDLKNKERELEENLMDLESIYNVHSKRPRIQTYEGIKSIESLYDEITDYANLKAKEILSFGTLAYLGTVHKESYKYWLKNIKSKRCHIREILNHDEYNEQYLQTIKKFDNPNHKIKFVPEDFKLFKNDNLIYGNKVALFSSYKDYFVIVIESENMVETFKAFFELAWKSSESVK